MRPCTEEELRPFKEVAREYLNTRRESVFKKLLSMLIGVEVKGYGSGVDYSIDDVCKEARRRFREGLRFDCEELENAQVDAITFVCSFTAEQGNINIYFNMPRERIKEEILRHILGDEYEKYGDILIW
jgi:hypothetical protein